MKNKGISLITLIVTIVVMLILIGVVGVYSFDTVNQGNESKDKREFVNVREFVLSKQAKIIAETDDIDTKYEDLVLNSELAYLVCENKLTDSEINNIVDVNLADIDLKYKYLYFQSEEKLFEDLDFTEGNLTVQDVRNDYIINFYTGTIIALTDNGVNVEGLIKGLGEILSEI